MSDPTPDMLAMPMFDDSAIDMKELLSRLAEQVANDVMDAEADQLCGGGRGEQPQRPLRTKPRRMRGHAYAAHPKLRIGSFFPENELERYQHVG